MDKEQTLDDVINQAIGIAEAFMSEVQPLTLTGQDHVLEELLRLMAEDRDYKNCMALADHIEDLARVIRIHADDVSDFNDF